METNDERGHEIKANNKRVIGYVRVEGIHEMLNGLSLLAQREAIESFCTEQGWSLISTCHDTLNDQHPTTRTGLQKALCMLRTGVADTLCVIRLDRISRNLSDLGKVLWEAQNRWAIVSLNRSMNDVVQ